MVARLSLAELGTAQLQHVSMSDNVRINICSDLADKIGQPHRNYFWLMLDALCLVVFVLLMPPFTENMFYLIS